MNIRRDLWIILVTIAFAFLVAMTIIVISNGSYIINPDSLKKIDKIKLAGRAYTNSPAKANGPNQIEFNDYKKHDFLISGSNFKAIDGNQLYDTLKYDGLVFSILTDANGYKTFYKINPDRRIEVYDVIIGGTSFINLAKINNAELKKLYSHLVLLFIIYSICLIFYFKNKMKD